MASIGDGPNVVYPFRYRELAACYNERFTVRVYFDYNATTPIDPAVLKEQVDFNVLFATHREATAKAIHKAMHHEPGIDWLLKNQHQITHCFHETGMRVMSVPQNVRCGPNASYSCLRYVWMLRNG